MYICNYVHFATHARIARRNQH